MGRMGLLRVDALVCLMDTMTLLSRGATHLYIDKPWMKDVLLSIYHVMGSYILIANTAHVQLFFYIYHLFLFHFQEA
jgi:hypothetical protein